MTPIPVREYRLVEINVPHHPLHSVGMHPLIEVAYLRYARMNFDLLPENFIFTSLVNKTTSVAIRYIHTIQPHYLILIN